MERTGKPRSLQGFPRGTGHYVDRFGWQGSYYQLPVYANIWITDYCIKNKITREQLMLTLIYALQCKDISTDCSSVTNLEEDNSLVEFMTLENYRVPLLDRDGKQINISRIPDFLYK